VDANGDTVSYVFEGKIVVQAGIRGFGDSGEYERELEAGDSVLVKKDATETARFTLPTQTPKFVRQMPELHLPIGLERGLAAYWSFDDPANLGKNSLGGGDLAAEGSPTRETAGALGGALRLRGNGHKDSLSFNGGRGVPSGVPTGDSSYSISAWCRVDAAVLPKGVFDIISWGEPTLGRANALILYGVSPEECMARNFWWDNDIAGNVETASIAGGWHHLATTYDRRGRMQYLYLDGVRIALRGVERRPDFGADHFAIGNRHKSLEPNSPYEWVGGLIDEIGVWDRALSEEEIAELYNNGKGLNPTVASDKTAKGGETERRASE
ncbi:MAG: LamG domain-containing protein, partial [Pirellulales bacterium]|nr:LamG domain-containing protein [Pirellulales bacterium]